MEDAPIESPVEEIIEEAPAEEAVEVVEEVVERKEPPPIPKGVQKRIDRAVRDKYEAQARAKVLEERLAALESQKPRQTISEAPKLEDYEDLDSYVTAKAEYIAEQKINTTLTEREKRQAEERQTAERTNIVEGWNKRVQAVTQELPDFQEVVESSDLPLSDVMREYLFQSDKGPHLAYHLAINEDTALELADMSPIAAIRALTRLEDQLSNTKETKTAAPDPIKPVGSKSKVEKSPNEMSQSEFEKWRRAQIAKR